jgi:hypothetical protein
MEPHRCVIILFSWSLRKSRVLLVDLSDKPPLMEFCPAPQHPSIKVAPEFDYHREKSGLM